MKKDILGTTEEMLAEQVKYSEQKSKIAERITPEEFNKVYVKNR